MKKYNYKEAICNDLKDWIEENKDIVLAQWTEGDKYDFVDWLNDEVWGEDAVTGNGPYSYASEEQCQEYIATNLDLYFMAANEFCDFPNSGTPWIYRNPAQHMDTTIRCYLLVECIWEVVDNGGLFPSNDD
jgi:hypothetical protein